MFDSTGRPVQPSPEQSPDCNLVWESAQRGADWLSLRLSPEALSENSLQLVDLYKVPFALFLTGRVREADQVLSTVHSRFLLPEGDLQGAQTRFARFRTYPHAWLCISALMIARFELAAPLFNFIVSYFDTRSGGFYATREALTAGEGHQEIMSSSMAGLACLWNGRLEMAEAAGQWLQRIFDAQPDISRGLYTVWHNPQGLVTDFPEEEARFFFVDASREKQFYFHYGISAAFLASLAAATGRGSWLQLAENFLDALHHFPGHVLRELRSGKIGWGASWTYRMNQNQDYRVMALEVAKGLLSLQSRDGSWSNPEQSSYVAGASEGTTGQMDVTAERVGQLGCIAMIL